MKLASTAEARCKNHEQNKSLKYLKIILLYFKSASSIPSISQNYSSNVWNIKDNNKRTYIQNLFCQIFISNKWLLIFITVIKLFLGISSELKSLRFFSFSVRERENRRVFATPMEPERNQDRRINWLGAQQAILRNNIIGKTNFLKMYLFDS